MLFPTLMSKTFFILSVSLVFCYVVTFPQKLDQL